MNRKKFCSLLFAMAGLLMSLGNPALAQNYFEQMPEGFEVVKVEDIPWQSAAEFSGIEVATLYGNPAEEGFYVIRVKFSQGNMSSPHFHDQDRFVTVILGTWWVGLSNDLGDIQPLEEGGFMAHPAGGIHFDGSVDGETIVEIRGVGPVVTTSVESVGSRD